jgi:hypothetical protein
MQFIRLVCYLAVLAVLAMTPAGEGAEKPKAVPTSWGKPVNGLQAGIRVKPGDPSAGAVLDLQVVIRNIGPKKVAFAHEVAPASFWGANEKGVVSIRAAYAYGGFALPGVRYHRKLLPGEEYSFGTTAVFRGLEVRSTVPTGGWVQLPPGDYRVGAEGVELWTSDGWKFELGTGYLDIEIPAEKK